MCSLFEMEKSGDLTDIVRASGGIYSHGGADSNSDSNPISNWQFSSETMNFPSVSRENYADPFLHLNDISASSSAIIRTIRPEESGGFPGGFIGDSMTLPRRIFRERSHQNISPFTSCDPPLLVNSQSLIKPSSMASNDIINPIGSNNCLVDNSSIQISPPRNSCIKRRKSQTKKVVCIPAPAPVNSRPSGEVVPSDLWAWRKYGQKPIKGSPYPRGYYRCSSSKGCSARKQVERSRTDPNMLVITYTSEHNHPWPTQRNALAGSTRSQASRNINNGVSSKLSNGGQTQKMISSKEEGEENGVPSGLYVKEEMEEIDQIRGLEMEDDDQFTSSDFFADLGEIEIDDNSFNLIFSEAFSGNKQKFDWTGNIVTTKSNSSSFHQEQKKDS